MLIDLQLHSTNSDGYLSPTKLAAFCHRRGIRVASLTDHNTVSGIEEFRRACRRYRIKVVPGLEIYVKLKRVKLNMLWYNFDTEHPDLHQLLRDSQNRRRSSVRRALNKLVKKKYHIDIPKLLDSHNHYIPINHVVDHFQEYNKTRIKRELKIPIIRESDVIRTYFRNPQKTMMNETYVSLERVLRLRKRVGGQLILGHPCKYMWVTPETTAALTKAGVDGLEVLSPHHSWDGVSYLQALVHMHHLIATGGSDFHRFDRGGQKHISDAWQYFSVDSKHLPGVQKIIAS